MAMDSDWLWLGSLLNFPLFSPFTLSFSHTSQGFSVVGFDMTSVKEFTIEYFSQFSI